MANNNNNNEIEVLISQHRLNAKLELIHEIQMRFPMSIGKMHVGISPYELHSFLIEELRKEQRLTETTEILNPIS